MKKAAAIIITVLYWTASYAQIIPPGLGATRWASWFALGIQQNLNNTNGKGWESTTYIGLARMSHPNDNNLVAKPGVFILNQEFKNKFDKNWEYSLAASYRRQNEYSDDPPYEQEDPSFKQEFRIYARLSYIFKTHFLEISPTLRQEVQKYYTPDFKPPAENLRLRSRFRLKFSVPLTANKVHRVLLFSEQLASASFRTDPKRWTPFGYKDSRFSLYYSLSPKNHPWVVNIGYMNNLMGKHKPTAAHYLGLDLIWKNPFQ